MRTLFAAAAATVALLAPAIARPQPVSAPSGPDTYLQLHLGAFVPRSGDLDGVEPGYSFGGTFGARFSTYVSVEGEVGYVRATGTSIGTRTTFADVPIAASLRLRMPLEHFEISGLGGGALHNVRLSTETGGVNLSESATAFGYQLGVAGLAQLWPTMLIGAEARWTFLDAKFAGVKTGLDGLRLALTLEYRF